MLCYPFFPLQRLSASNVCLKKNGNQILITRVEKRALVKDLFCLVPRTVRSPTPLYLFQIRMMNGISRVQWYRSKSTGKDSGRRCKNRPSLTDQKSPRRNRTPERNWEEMGPGTAARVRIEHLVIGRKRVL